MKKQIHKSRGCKATMPSSKISKPEIGKYVKVNGEWVFRASKDIN